VDAISRVQQARLAQSTRTLATLTAQYGATDSSVTALAAAIAQGKVKVSQVQALQHQMSVPQTTVDAKGWALKGNVLDPEYRPLARHTVYLVDDRKAWQRQYGFAYTDDAGYFSLSFTGTEGDTAKETLFPAVVDTQAKPVYLATDPFTPVVGAASYLQILVAEGEPALGDPPAEIRSIAIPEEAVQQENKATPTQVD
jgi:hypothetical protein